MATTAELEGLYRQAKYREVIESADKNDPEQFLLVGWAYHQLGEYDKSKIFFAGLVSNYQSSSKIGESARRGLAHSWLQTDGISPLVEGVMKEIPPSIDLDNVYMNAVLVKARKGETISVELVIGRIIAALTTVPYKTVSGHIINNGVLTLHEARSQEGVRPYLSILPGLMDAAIGIYEATGTAENHIAGAEYRAALICRASGWKKLALVSAQESVDLWRPLACSQGGERYQKNLEGAEKLLRELKEEGGISLI